MVLIRAKAGQHAASAGMLADTCIHNLLHGIQIFLTGSGNMVISNLLQPVHTNKGLPGICRLIIGAFAHYKIGISIDGGIIQLSLIYHSVIIGRSNGRKLVHIDGGQITVIRPLCQLGIIKLRQHGRKRSCGCEQRIVRHNIVTGDRNEFYGNIPLIAEVFLNPLGPVIVHHIRNTFHASVVNRNLKGYILRKRLPAVHTCSRFRGCRFS